MSSKVRLISSLVAVALALPLASLTGGAHAAADVPASVVALPGYQISVWARGTTKYSHPDSILSDSQHVFVGYQDVTAKDGSDNKSSTVVEYSLRGQVVRTFSALGHLDGLRMNPATHLLWALADEDGDPHLTTIDPSTGATQLYQFAKTAHCGGFDDMAFSNGLAFMDASNPNLNTSGDNVFPALDTVTLSNGRVNLTTVLMGNATSTDITAGNDKKATLNLIDPDSLTLDPSGDLVLDNQAGAQLVFIKAAGTSRQWVRSLVIGDAVDDSLWPTSAAGRFLISDTAANVIYSLQSTTFSTSSLYATTPNDSGVARFVGTIDLTSGVITPIAIGFASPHGMTFLPDSI
jgi:hypothetical protein